MSQHEPGEMHVLPVRTYATVYVVLLLLMAATVAIASFNLGPLNNMAAMAIAVGKAVLVVLFFMGVKYSSKLTWVWAAAGFLWLIILFGTLIDYMVPG